MITSLLWQPSPHPVAAGDGSERLLASAGEDGIISLWNVLAPESKPKSSMTMDSAVVSLAFTPDGAYLAGSTDKQVLIWKTAESSLPRACWNRTAAMGVKSPKLNGTAPEEDTHCLCWDAQGQKLAYGVNGQVCLLISRVTCPLLMVIARHHRVSQMRPAVPGRTCRVPRRDPRKPMPCYRGEAQTPDVAASRGDVTIETSGAGNVKPREGQLWGNDVNRVCNLATSHK